jgi:hypothetical protein
MSWLPSHMHAPAADRLRLAAAIAEHPPAHRHDAAGDARCSGAAAGAAARSAAVPVTPAGGSASDAAAPAPPSNGRTGSAGAAAAAAVAAVAVVAVVIIAVVDAATRKQPSLVSRHMPRNSNSLPCRHLRTAVFPLPT